jgi:rubrerythrin
MTAQSPAPWTLDDIDWAAFRGDLVDPSLLEVAKAAALVEVNSRDYVTYLNNVFRDDPALQEEIARWGEEEEQHGKALGRWAEMADPSFSLDRARERFRATYRLPLDLDHSVRGSQAGELLARCVVESGTASFYSAIRDQAREPVLSQIAGRIAADEFRHYKLFYDRLGLYQGQENLSLFKRLKVAVGRVQESGDDELAAAYFAANVPDHMPFDSNRYARAYERVTLTVYRRRHIERGFSMIGKALGIAPHGWPVRLSAALFWLIVGLRSRWLAQPNVA